jgi:predicted transcriptional regulator
MATMNFSVPDDVKEAFNRLFDGQNKSAVVTALMREAIEREERRQRSVAAIDRILENQKDPTRPRLSSARLAAIRRKGRP